MLYLILLFLLLIVVGLLMRVLGKAAGDKGSESIGAAISGFGKAGCGCLVIIVVLSVLLVILMNIVGPPSSPLPL